MKVNIKRHKDGSVTIKAHNTAISSILARASCHYGDDASKNVGNPLWKAYREDGDNLWAMFEWIKGTETSGEFEF